MPTPVSSNISSMLVAGLLAAIVSVPLPSIAAAPRW